MMSADGYEYSKHVNDVNDSQVELIESIEIDRNRYCNDGNDTTNEKYDNISLCI